MDPDFDALSPTEQIAHVQDLWDRVARRSPSLPVSPELRAELDRRLEHSDAHPEDSTTWEAAKTRLLAKR